MITLDKKTTNTEWVEYDEDVSFELRPFPLSQRSLTPSGSNIIEVLIKQAIYCLVDWKGIVDTEGELIKCDAENKKFLFDYSDELVNFVCDNSAKLNAKLVNISSKKT